MPRPFRKTLCAQKGLGLFQNPFSFHHEEVPIEFRVEIN